MVTVRPQQFSASRETSGSAIIIYTLTSFIKGSKEYKAGLLPEASSIVFKRPFSNNTLVNLAALAHRPGAYQFLPGEYRGLVDMLQQCVLEALKSVPAQV